MLRSAPCSSLVSSLRSESMRSDRRLNESASQPISLLYDRHLVREVTVRDQAKSIDGNAQWAEHAQMEPGKVAMATSSAATSSRRFTRLALAARAATSSASVVVRRSAISPSGAWFSTIQVAAHSSRGSVGSGPVRSVELGQERLPGFAELTRDRQGVGRQVGFHCHRSASDRTIHAIVGKASMTRVSSARAFFRSSKYRRRSR